MAGERDGLRPERTVGQLGDVARELEIDPGQEWIAPDIFPARQLCMTDLSLVSAPLAAFSGWVRRADQHVKPLLSPGLILIGGLYALRGLIVVPALIRLVRGAGYPFRQTSFSAVALAIGLLYLFGAARRWGRL